jgi:formylglycine-generating enzyme required for sulfatase activity
MKHLLVIGLTIPCILAFAQEDLKPYNQTVQGTSVNFKMVPIPAGKFRMGSPDAQPGHQPDESPQKEVAVSAFWMAALETTHDEFGAFWTDQTVTINSTVDAVTRPTSQYIDLSWGMGKDGGFPVNSMSQNAALMYCRWLYKKTGIFYRLPTEAEWEYACRAGSTSVFPWGDDPKELNKYAWNKSNSKNKYQKTGTLFPNAWGLYDILGNVAEWTLDQYDAQYLSKLSDTTRDPIVPPASRYPKTVKGGSYLDGPEQLRPASRASSDPSWNKRDPQFPKSRWWLTDAAFVGFRVVRPLKQPSPQEAEDFFKLYLGQ